MKNWDLVTSALNYINSSRKDVKVVQIGAMDGFSFDDIRGHLEKFKWDEILVEPIPDIFEQLKSNLSHRTNCTFENSAITTTDKTVKMITVEKKVVDDNNLHPGYQGMSALYPLKNGFGTDFERDIYVRDNLATEVNVNGITFKTLVKKYNIKNIDILICDAEGYDWTIFNQLDLDIFTPLFIRLEYCNLTEEEKKITTDKLDRYGYVYELGQDITAVKKEIHSIIYNEVLDLNSNQTIVTGLWNINRPGRDFNHYIEAFKRFLDIPQNLFIYIPKEYEYLVWEKRSHDNTFVRLYELEDIKKLYEPFWDRTQKIRQSGEWLDQVGWLKDSPQAVLEMYNPIVQSKMFMLNDASIMNPFDTEYHFWVDAGITNTVPHGDVAEDNLLDKLHEYSEPFLFLSYPYLADKEIHGFNYQAMNRIAENEVKYVCRGGIFGGKKLAINNANATYYSLLDHTLAQDLMGTEESVFTLMSYMEPNVYRRYELDENGLIVKFTQAIKENNVTLSKASVPIVQQVDEVNYKEIKTNLYMLTFNFPEQVLHTIESMKKTPEWLTVPSLFLLDNSTDNTAKIKNQEIAKEYNFTYIDLGGNTGICGGRQAAADHFDKSDAHFMFFFEDDMTSNPPELEGQFCRNGFRKYIPNLYNTVHKIMLEKDFDFLKLSFTEVYFDNDKQCSWYNVPQNIRTRDWPDYDKLPITGLDPNCPRTKFNHIYTKDDLSYVSGEIYYANWPMIVSKEGNRKMFIDTKWAHPFEQTWMSHIYQLTKEEKIRPAILLASPIWHDRIKHYQPEERREN